MTLYNRPVRRIQGIRKDLQHRKVNFKLHITCRHHSPANGTPMVNSLT